MECQADANDWQHSVHGQSGWSMQKLCILDQQTSVHSGACLVISAIGNPQKATIKTGPEKVTLLADSMLLLAKNMLMTHRSTRWWNSWNNRAVKRPLVFLLGFDASCVRSKRFVPGAHHRTYEFWAVGCQLCRGWESRKTLSQTGEFVSLLLFLLRLPMWSIWMMWFQHLEVAARSENWCL